MKKISTIFFLIAMASASFAQDAPKAKIELSTTLWCEGDEIKFGNRSTDADSFIWEMGNGDSLFTKGITYTYTIESELNEVEFTVTLTAINKATFQRHSTTQLVRLQKSAKADFDFESLSLVCFFTPKCENFLGLSWHFGDGATSLVNAETITHVYPPGDATYTCRLKASSSYGCDDSISKEIVIVDSASSSIQGYANVGQLSLYPNPSSDQVLSFDLQNPEKLSFSVSDTKGRIIFKSAKNYESGN